jgi:class 3 adenylate cyclase
MVSQEVVDAASEAQPTFDAIGPVDLKGVAGAVSLHTAHRAAGGT